MNLGQLLMIILKSKTKQVMYFLCLANAAVKGLNKKKIVTFSRRLLVFRSAQEIQFDILISDKVPKVQADTCIIIPEGMPAYILSSVLFS